MGGMISGILGGGNSQAQAAQQEELAKARAAMQWYRPEAMQARINLFNNASSAYQGANNALETMYGGAPVGQGTGFQDPASFRDSSPRTVMGHEVTPAMVAPSKPRGG